MAVEAQRRLVSTRQVLREMGPESRRFYRRLRWQRRISFLKQLFRGPRV